MLAQGTGVAIRCGALVKWLCSHSQSPPATLPQTSPCHHLRHLPIFSSRPEEDARRQTSVAVMSPTPLWTNLGAVCSTLRDIAQSNCCPSPARPTDRECQHRNIVSGVCHLTRCHQGRRTRKT